MRNPPVPSSTHASTEVAIIGIGCRFPGGAHTPAAYWRFLAAGGDAVRPVPAERWSALHHDPDPATAGRSYTSRGGFLDDPSTFFDAAFFGISPREAETLDPQQRLLLEVAWEALEDAGLPLADAQAACTGVYIGGFTLDSMLMRFQDLDQVDGHTATSSSMTLLSNRISYALDLHGPSMTIDTACSSSLVATHLAARALVEGECELALAGGVNLMLLPNFQVVMCKGRFLAPDGRSKAFDADADGYGRGEGAGVVVLKRLDAALRDGDRIYAVIAGTGVNQDGATDGIAQPSPAAQEALIRSVCARFGLDPARIGYVEAHGTGTALGDPVEVGALGAVYGRPGRDDAPWLGSVKASIGHLEAAAGVAGLVKAALAVQQRTVPPQRAPSRLNPALRLDQRGLRLPLQPEAWPQSGPAWAAVNSFGYGGTNAHAVLREAPTEAGRTEERLEGLEQPAVFLALSARGGEALQARAGQIADLLESGAPLHRVAATLAWHRSALSDRAAVPCPDRDTAIARLRALQRGPLAAPAPARAVAWIYSGMGPQWAGMGRGLKEDPDFYEGWRAATEAMARYGVDVRDALDRDPADLPMQRNDVAQPCNFAVQVGLTFAMRRHGLAPAAIVGHSTGEMAAAWAAGALDLEDAARVVAVRARLQQEVAGGGMCAVGLGVDEVGAHLDAVRAALPGGVLEIAAINAHHSVTVAGDHACLAALTERLAAQGCFCRAVRVEVAYHSAQVDPIEARLRAALADIRPQTPAIPLWSTVDGQRVERAVHDADYWWRNTRGVVRLQAALEGLRAHGVDLYVQMGPHPVLAAAIQEVGGARALAAMVRGEDEITTLHNVVGRLWEAGQAVHWRALVPRARALDLPTYPWQRRRHWRQPAPLPPPHPLLSAPVDGPHPAWTTRLDGAAWAWLRDHQVGGAAIVPGALWIEALLAAALARTSEDLRVVLTELRFPAAMALADAGQVQTLRIQVDGDHIEVYGRTGGSGDWLLHAEARRSLADRWAPPAALPGEPAAEPEAVDVGALYQDLATRGLRYGPAFRSLRAVQRGPAEVWAVIDASPGRGLRVPPQALDAAFQALLAMRPDDSRTLVPVGVERLHLAHAPAPGPWSAHGRLRADDGDALLGDLRLRDAQGRVFLSIVGLRCRRVAAPAAPLAWWHRPTWQPLDLITERRPSSRPGQLWRAPASTDPVGKDLLSDLLDRVRAGQRELVVVTCGAFAVHDGEATDPAHGALWGLARVVMSERPELGLRLLDVDKAGTMLSDAALLAALGEEEEAALRDGRCWASRLCRVAPERPEARAVGQRGPAGARPARLVNAEPGSLDGLRWVERPRQPPGPGRVEVQVEAASLNFKDVMKALGLLDAAALEDSYLGTELGMEAMGTVLRVGPGVELRPGQRVLVYAGGVLRTHADVDARFVLPCPEGWTPEQAASFFVTATAWHALIDVGRLQAGETVLVHSAAGGVGLAAVHIARAVGARVIATAGTERKRQWLRAQGLELVLDSRTLDFADAVRQATDGRGVQVVLNALSGPAIEQGLRCLAPGGRFLELGKKDLSAQRALALDAFNRRLTLSAIDLDRAATEDPAYFPPLAQTVIAALQSGRLPHLPARTFPADEAVAAFRALAGGDWIGKVVLRMAGEMTVHPDLGPHLRPAPDRTWLVTGGLSGFGLQLGRALVQAGARHLVLASRRAQPDTAAAATIAALARQAQVEIVALDVADPAAVNALIARIEAGPAPLGGVVHAATTYDDRPLSALDAATLSRGLAAKAWGAWNLHQATCNLPLQAFICCSSVAAQVGNPGQGLYAAANTFLDSLAELRRSQGLPGTSVALGALGGVGRVARDRGTEAHLRSLGLEPMPPGLAAEAVLRAAAEGHGRVGLIDIDWERWARAHAATPWRRLESLRGDAANTEEAGLIAALRALPVAEREVAALRALVEAAAPVFGLDVDGLDGRRPLRELGLDSLMAVELATVLHRASGMEVSAMDLLGGRSLASLAGRLVARIEPATPAPVAPVTTPDVGGLRDRICVQAPYEALDALRWEGDHLCARVRPVALPGEGPLSSAELGRHLAILGSMAVAARQPTAQRHAYPVAAAELEMPALNGPPVAIAEARARAILLDATTGLGEAETTLRDAEGRLLGRMRVRYHVLPMDQFRALYADHAQPTPDGEDPYAQPPVLLRVRHTPGRLEADLPPVDPAACLGHFDGLPALPVSILGRHVFAAVALAAHADGLPADTALATARLQTHRFLWAGEAPRLIVTGHGNDWRCEVRVGPELAAHFDLGLHRPPPTHRQTFTPYPPTDHSRHHQAEMSCS